MNKFDVFELTNEYTHRCFDKYGRGNVTDKVVLNDDNINAFLSWLPIEYTITNHVYTYFYQDVSYTVRKKTFRGFKLTIGGINCGVFLRVEDKVNNTIKGNFYPAIDIMYDTQVKGWKNSVDKKSTLNTLGIVTEVPGVKEWSDTIISDAILDRSNMSIDKLFKMV